jgi:multisubunit Na+/H+ antiporter MnhB subunit
MLARSGIESPVAAVVLDLRGFDTLLETAVLFSAVLAVWCLGVIRFRRPPWPVDPVLASLARVLTALLFLVAAHLLGVGLHGPGGGFQAGAVLGAAGVLWTLADRRAIRLGEHRAARVGLALGLGLFLVAGILPTLAGRPLLTHQSGNGALWAVALEGAIAISVGLTLTALFMGGLAELPEEPDPSTEIRA